MEKKKIYLAGSFLNFRDKIIAALGYKYEFADPRKNRQHSIATLVVDDMGGAEECPILLACFPKDKPRGKMTYGEIGGSRAKGNYIIIADETGKRDTFLDSISNYKLNKIDDAINFLKENNPGRNVSRAITKKQNKDNKLRMFLATNIEYFKEIEKVYQNDENKVLMYGDFEDLKNFGKADLTIVHFPKGGNRNKKAIFFMGASYALKIPIVMIEENPIIYPPLAGLPRRIFTEKEIALDYLIRLNSQEIQDEAKVMYSLFQKYRS